MNHTDLYYCYKNYEKELRHLFNKYKLTPLFPILEILIKKNIRYDENLYSLLHKIKEIKCKEKNSSGLCEVEFNEMHNLPFVMTNIKKLFNIAKIRPDIKTYLDIGSGSGMKADFIGKEIHAKRIMCLDVEGSEFVMDKNVTCEKKYYNGINPPYDDNSIDMITSFMVLHHVPKKNLEILLNNFRNKLTSNGLFLISEHNANKKIRPLINVQHDLILSVKKDYEYNTTRI